MEDHPITDSGDHLPHFAEDVREDPTGSGSLLRWIGELVFLVGLAFVLAMGIRTYIVQPFYIPTGSMVPTLQIGDRVLVNKFIYRFRDPQPGDIIVFDAPNDGDVDLIKRVIAVAGQTIDIDDGLVTVDGVTIDEPYRDSTTADTSSLVEPITVPEGSVFIMGDNRINSSDSRIFGPQPTESVLGHAFAIYWPLTDLGGL